MAVLILALFVFPALANHQVPKILGRRVYRSPNRTLMAAVVSLQQLHSYGDSPSRVEIRGAGRRLLAVKDHSELSGQGYTVEKAAWTADSRFFVYIVTNSGGHSPWHHPMFFYSRKRHHIYSLDDALRSLGHGDGSITGGMELRSPSTVLTHGRYHGKSRPWLRTTGTPSDGSEEPVLSIDLRWIEGHLI